MNDFPQTALPLLSTDHAASALSSELAAPPHLRPHAGASELGQLTDDRLEAILRVDALADPVHDRVRDTLAAVFPSPAQWASCTAGCVSPRAHRQFGLPQARPRQAYAPKTMRAAGGGALGAA